MANSVQFDYTLLEKRIRQCFGSKAKYAEVSKTICRTSLIYKMKNKWPFTDEEMLEASELLKFENGVDDIPKYFFTPLV